MSLATKYRPSTLEDVVGQTSIKKILGRQIELRQFKNCYLFNGSSGCGKTTCARILANAINKGVGTPIEIDAASNNGVDNVKDIVKSASERSIDSEYKIYILDECHSLTIQAWQAFLKCIEEPPKYTIFIFCTTEKNKVPDTIKNRCQVFNFNRVSSLDIERRLNIICEKEGFTNYKDACNYISKISNGQVRDAVANLEKCASYSTDLNMTNVINALGDYSYDKFFSIVKALLDGREDIIYNNVDSIYNEGTDIKLFIDRFLEFCIDCAKYCLFKNVDATKIPTNLLEELDSVTQFNDALKFYNYYSEHLLELKNMLKTDISPRSSVEVMLCKMARLEK